MAIIAIASATLLPRLAVPYRPAKPPEVLFLEEQRARAIEESHPVRVILRDGILIGEPGERRLALPDNHLLLIVRPEMSAYLTQRVVAVFYPDGTATWGQFVLMKKDGPRETVLFKVGIEPIHGEIIYVSP